MKSEDLLKKIVSHSKEYGFVFPSSEVYDGLGAVYDYGPLGIELKNNIKAYWWQSMVQKHENIVGLDSAIFMHPLIWKASGHVDAFNDPLIDNKDSKKRYRVDVLVEDYVEKLEQKVQKEIEKEKKKLGDSFDEKHFIITTPSIVKIKEKQKTAIDRLVKGMEKEDFESLQKLIEDLDIADPETGSKNWTNVRNFNLMFSTQLGVTNNDNLIYLRPETAQGIFVNFLNVQRTGRQKIPFGIAQIGKAFRNEIVARQFIFRMREFEQMEMQFFVTPGEELKWFEYWKEERHKWHLALGIDKNKYRFHDHDKLAHYANAATDIQFDFPFGFKELEGIHSRTDYDLKSHQELSKKKLSYFDPQTQESFIPYVIETSVGVDRMFLAVLSSSYQEEVLESGDTRTVLKIHPSLAPAKAAILPLVKKDGLPELAKKILDDLKYDFQTVYDDKDTIGRRYRRQDAQGTPFCITIDHDSIKDQSVTIRDRDTMNQERVAIAKISDYICKKINIKQLLNF